MYVYFTVYIFCLRTFWNQYGIGRNEMHRWVAFRRLARITQVFFSEKNIGLPRAETLPSIVDLRRLCMRSDVVINRPACMDVETHRRAVRSKQSWLIDCPSFNVPSIIRRQRLISETLTSRCRPICRYHKEMITNQQRDWQLDTPPCVTCQCLVWRLWHCC